MAHAHVLTPEAVSSSLHSRLASTAKSIWRGYWTRRAERAAVFALQTLDDHTLKDIGIDRSEIESVVYARPHARYGRAERRLTVCAKAC